MQPVQIRIYNIKRQELFSTSILPNAGFTWNAKDIPSGVYFMKATQGERSQTTKILKLQ